MYTSVHSVCLNEAQSRYHQYQSLVPKLAWAVKRRCPAAIERQDLEQIGYAALWKCCTEFDPAQEASFSVYLHFRIRGAMLDAVRKDFREAVRERDADRLDDDRPHRTPSALTSSAFTSEPFLDRAIAELGPTRSAIVQMRFREGMSRKETGELLDLSVSSVARSERAAVRDLRQRLKAA